MKYKVGTNQYKKKTKKDVGAYMISFLYLMILMVALYDISIFLSPTPSDASDTNTVKVSPIAVPAEPKQVVEVLTATPAATLKPVTRREKLEAFLIKKGSPMAKYADLIVRKADEYDISYTLITSIAGTESSFETDGDTTDYNAWGIMTWDKAGKRSIRKFKSWEDSIDYVSHMLSAKYRSNMNQAIQAKYCPSFECSETWVPNVTNFQLEIDNPDLKRIN